MTPTPILAEEVEGGVVTLHLDLEDAAFLAALLRERCAELETESSATSPRQQADERGSDRGRLVEILSRLDETISDERERTRAAMPIAP